MIFTAHFADIPSTRMIAVFDVGETWNDEKGVGAFTIKLREVKRCCDPIGDFAVAGSGEGRW